MEHVEIDQKDLVTARVTLKVLSAESVDDAVRIFTNDCVKKTYMLPDLDEQGAVNLYNRLVKLSCGNEHYIRGIYLHDNLIGLVNDTEIKGTSMELGWALHPNYHNMGYATEAVRAAIADLFRMGFKEITAGAFSQNKASMRVMEKCGMYRLDKTEMIDYRGSCHTCIFYGIGRQNYDLSGN